WNNPALTAIPEVDSNFATGRVRLGAEETKLDASGLDGTSYTRLIVVGKIPELPVQAGLTGDGDGDRHPPLERLVVRENPLIRTLAGVRPRRAPVGIQLVDNPELRDVSALADLESIRNLALTRNSRLESVEFRGLDRIGPKGRIGAGTLEIRGNKRLRTVDFATSESASDGRAFGSVNIVKTSRLTSIQGWPSRVSRLAIVRNDSLVRLGPEGVFDTVDRAIQIRGNPKLTSLGALSKARGADRIRIDNNDTLTGLSALSRFKQLVRLQITGNDGLTSLRGLKALTSVEELIVQGNACLPSSEVDWLMKRLKKKSLVSRTTERNGGGPGCSSD
ncbi:MAG: hypothetical protein ABEL76_05905, partial [Bradymonadaceae bacterium]